MIIALPQMKVVTKAQLAHDLALNLAGNGRVDDGALRCALVRSVVWALSRSGRPCQTLKITNASLELAGVHAAGADEHALRRHVRDALSELADVGDLLELPGGNWHPAALREIDLGTSGVDGLLVGGLPTSALPEDLRDGVVHHAALRRLPRGSALRDALGIPFEHVDSWARAPEHALAEWAAAIMDSKLSEYTPSSEELGVRVYAPSQGQRGASQGRRWADQVGALAGRFLAQRSRVYGAREYRVIEIGKGRVTRSGDVLLPGEARRLMYAMDAVADNPVEVPFEDDGAALRLALWSELPRSEQRTFAAVGSLQAPLERYYPRTWRFEGAARGVARARLEALHVKLVPMKSLGGDR